MMWEVDTSSFPRIYAKKELYWTVPLDVYKKRMRLKRLRQRKMRKKK